MKTYIVSKDVYMFVDERGLSEMTAESHRDLLLQLLDLKEDQPLDEDEPESKHVRDLSTEELQKWFDDANGDGQPYVQVWCVEDHKQVLG